jgi:hypothetical protein
MDNQSSRYQQSLGHLPARLELFSSLDFAGAKELCTTTNTIPKPYSYYMAVYIGQGNYIQTTDCNPKLPFLNISQG